jgi:hypothetical protein
MASPQYTSSITVLASQSLAASASVTATVDWRGKFQGSAVVKCTFGTVAATAGLQVNVFRSTDGGSTFESIASTSFVIPATASTSKGESAVLGQGYYQFQLTNLDATNGLTAVSITGETVDAIA